MKHFMLAFCLSFFGFVTTVKAQKEISIYTWPEYVFDPVVEMFQKETGIKVNLLAFDDMNQMSDTIDSKGGQGYDIVMPAIEYISRLKKQNYLMPLDKTQLPNMKNLNSNYVNLAFDPNNDYSIPFAFGTSTFVVNKDKVNLENFKKLDDLARPEYKNRILLPSDARAVLGIGLRMKGYSLNEKSDPKLKEAFEILKQKITPNVKNYDSDNSVDALKNGDVDIAMMWSGMAYKVTREDPRFVEVDLLEGKPFWIDNLVILKNAPNPVAAHKFLNFLMRPDITVKLNEGYVFSSPNVEGVKLLCSDIQKNKTLYPDKETLQKSEFELDLGASLRLFEKYWKMLKSGG